MAGTGPIEAGKAEVSMGLDDSKLVRGLSLAKNKLLAFGTSIVGVGTAAASAGLAVAAAGIAAVGAASAVAVGAAVSAGDAFADMSARTGVSAEKLQSLKYAAEQGGASIDDVEKAIRTMQKGIGSGDKSFEKFGLSLAKLKTMNPEEQFAAVADAIAAIDDPTKRTAAAMELLGKSGAQLVPMLADGSKGLAELEDKARSLGLVMSNDDVAAAGTLADTLGQLWAQVSAVAVQVGAALVPAVQAAANVFSAIVAKVTDYVRENRKAIDSVVEFGTQVGAVMVTAGAAVGRFAIDAVASVQEFVGKFTSGLSGIGDEARKTMAAIATAVSSGDITAAIDLLWAQIGVVWAEGIATITGLWDALWKTSLAQTVADGILNVATAYVEGWARIKGIGIDIAFELQNEWSEIFATAMDTLAGYATSLWRAVVDAFKSEWAQAKAAVETIAGTAQAGGSEPDASPQTKADGKAAREAERKAAHDAAEASRRETIEALHRLREQYKQPTDGTEWRPNDGSWDGGPVDAAKRKAEEAQRRLNELRKAQEDAKAQGDGQFDLAALRKSMGLPPLDGKNKTTTETAKPATDVMATFSARAAMGIAGASDAATTARNTTRIANDIHQIAARPSPEMKFT